MPDRRITGWAQRGAILPVSPGRLPAAAARNSAARAPIKMAKVGPMGLSNWAFYMLKDVQHPNLAKLWAYWITTPNGQKALADIDGTGFTTSAGAPIAELSKGKKIGWLTRDYMKKNGRRLIKKYAKIMKIR